MKKLILFVLLFFTVIVPLWSQTKVLFLGNSFTYTYDIPGLFSGLSSAGGFSVFVDENTQAGMAVANEQITGHINDPISQAKIISQQWDYIVVQDNQGDYVNNVGVIPAACGNANITLYNQIKANNECTRIIYFAGWGPEGGVATGDNTTSCINRIHGNMLYLNDAIADEIVTPIGKAWITSLSQLPSVDLYYSDNVHPSLAGSYLAAATIFTTIFKINPSPLTFTGGVNSATAQTMRNIAYNTVTLASNMTGTNLDAFSPVITQNGNVLSIPASYSSYQWYKGNVQVGSNYFSYTVTQSGDYKVVVTDINGCTFSSFIKSVTITESELSEQNEQSINFLTLGENMFRVNTKQECYVFLFDNTGKLVRNFGMVTAENTIDLNSYEKGIYIIRIQHQDESYTQKIILQ